MSGDISLLPPYASMAWTALQLPYRETWEMIPERLRSSHSIRFEKVSHSTLYTWRLASDTWSFWSLLYLFGLRKDRRQTQGPPLTLNGRDLTEMTIKYPSKQSVPLKRLLICTRLHGFYFHKTVLLRYFGHNGTTSAIFITEIDATNLRFSLDVIRRRNGIQWYLG
jgi:hypothetical protein